MASISKKPNGSRVIQYVEGKRRRTIYIGKCSERHAEQVRNRVELLQAAKLSGQPVDPETLAWLMKIDDALHAKLAKVHLVDERGISQLGPFMENYLASRKDLKDSTRVNLAYAQGELLEHFGANRLIQSITEGDADEFRQFLFGKGLGENTVRRKCGRARQFFNAAIRKRIIVANPFKGMPCTVNANESRLFFVTVEMANKILEACPDQQWRTLFSLCRWGGLRCPSEVMPLTWADVDWENDRLHVTSPKTKHQGKGSRIVPLFPELREQLEAAFDEADPGSKFVITRYRGGNANLRTQMNRIIRRAGLEPWEKPFQNLRSTRETELAERFPMHKVCRWIGNSELVAAKHYLQLTDDDFKEAAGKALQNALQQDREGGDMERKTKKQRMA